MNNSLGSIVTLVSYGKDRTVLAGRHNPHHGNPWGFASGVPSSRSSSAGRSPDAARCQYQGVEEIVRNLHFCN